MKNNSLVPLPRLSVISALCTVILTIAWANSALAQQWRSEPVFKVGGEYDDNAELDPRTDEEVDETGFLLDARADINYASPSTSFSVQPRVLISKYNDDSADDSADDSVDRSVDDSNDYFLRSNFRRQGALNTFGFRVNFDHQSVRTGERSDSDLEIEDPDEITDDETGRTLLRGDRSKWRFAPYWQYQFSQLSSIGAGIDYFDTQYDDVFAGILSDYSDTRLNLTYRRSLSNVTTGLISLTGRRYDSDELIDDIDGYGIRAGIEHALSQKTKFTAAIGMEDTDRLDAGSDSDVVGSATLTHNLETIRLWARYQRSINASGSGIVSVRDSFNLGFRRRLSEKLSAGLGVYAYKQGETIDDPSSVEDTDDDYVQLQSSFVWYLSRSFVIEADYRYTILDRGDDFGGRANSNRLNLWFIYQPKTIPKL